MDQRMECRAASSPVHFNHINLGRSSNAHRTAADTWSEIMTGEKAATLIFSTQHNLNFI